MSSSFSNAPKKIILIMAGGTGGHIFPAIAVAEKLQSEGWEIQWLGTADRMEAQIVPNHGFTLHCLNVTGLRGRGAVAKLKALMALVKAIYQAIKLIKRIQPAVVLGMGGYASGPGGIAARMVGKPLLIHEQNVVLGLTNKWLAKFADLVMLGFEAAQKQLPNNPKVVVTGNPIRQKIMTMVRSDVESEAIDPTINILILGGSLGARPFNQQLPLILKQLDNVNIRHQSGKANKSAVEAQYQSPNSQVRIDEFIDDMSAAYEWADVVICRAGAITVTEIALAGVAAIFIPLPHAVDDHQTANANSLVERRAGFLINQVDLPGKLLNLLNDIMVNPEQLKTIRLNALDCAISTGTDKVAELCEKFSQHSGDAGNTGVLA
jgi:UDP-N-acetylglucosamine--N-acetylmuramyl-(pentapeptide) pyrophosphoryl-undecaprenol N-acetylglucosamine transferase